MAGEPIAPDAGVPLPAEPDTAQCQEPQTPDAIAPPACATVSAGRRPLFRS
jgi:hypothetical protein